MSEVFFYHLTQTRLEVALPKILERALSADWSVELRIGMEADIKPLVMQFGKDQTTVFCRIVWRITINYKSIL